MTSVERIHNKSGLSTLSILACNLSEIEEWYCNLSKKLQPADGLIQGSPCLLLPAKDGRYSHMQRKVAYGYQIVAFMKFGRDQLKPATASKLKDDLTISHLCGTRNCCNPDHLILDSKATNDERTHCHFGLGHAIRAKGPEGIHHWMKSSCCPHTPKCGQLQWSFETPPDLPSNCSSLRDLNCTHSNYKTWKALYCYLLSLPPCVRIG